MVLSVVFLFSSSVSWPWDRSVVRRLCSGGRAWLPRGDADSRCHIIQASCICIILQPCNCLHMKIDSVWVCVHCAAPFPRQATVDVRCRLSAAVTAERQAFVFAGALMSLHRLWTFKTHRLIIKCLSPPARGPKNVVFRRRRIQFYQRQFFFC